MDGRVALLHVPGGTVVLKQGDQVREGGVCKSGPPRTQTTQDPDHPDPALALALGRLRAGSLRVALWTQWTHGVRPLSRSAEGLLPSGLCSRLQAY